MENLSDIGKREAGTLLRKIVFDPNKSGDRTAWGIVVAILLIYAIAFFCFYPKAVTNDDEAGYLRQARLLNRGQLVHLHFDPVVGEEFRFPTEEDPTYPLGTAALMAPFIAAAGWRGAYMAPFLGLILGTLLTARWIQEERRSPVFALFIFGFPALLVMARVAMSDVPSFAIVALGLWLFWRGLDGSWRYWLASGFVAGASIAVREPNALLFAPFFAGTVIRRETKCWALVAGGLAGVSIWFLLTYGLFGDSLRVQHRNFVQIEGIEERIFIYLLGLLVFIPAGLFFALAYRGRRAPELKVTVCGFVFIYMLSYVDSNWSAWPKRLILDWRYMVPLLPIVAFAASESLPRLWLRLLERSAPAKHSALWRLAGFVSALWIVGIATESLAVHYGLHHWSLARAGISEAIDRHTGDESVIITNRSSTLKYLHVLDRRFRSVDRSRVTAEATLALAQTHGEVFIVFLDRHDSEAHREIGDANAAFIESFDPAPTLEFDRWFNAEERLRIWRFGHTR